MSDLKFPHFDTCSHLYPEKPHGEPPIMIDLGEGHIVLQCGDCGGHMQVTIASPDSNVETNRSELLKRSLFGVQKYGTTTNRTDLSTGQWFQHILEELLDAANYVQAAKSQLIRLEPSSRIAFYEGFEMARQSVFEGAPHVTSTAFLYETVGEAWHNSDAQEPFEGVTNAHQENEADSRLFDILLGDDGQAYKEAERYLMRKNPELHSRLLLKRNGQ